MIIDINLYNSFKEQSVVDRYVTISDFESYIKKSKLCDFNIEGGSVREQSIYSLTMGCGDVKVLMWSQMHGNESTSTKSIFDLINFFKTDHPIATQILKSCTIKILPILNPDGAQDYTRLNTNKVDLNRDAQQLSQPESIVLQDIFNDFKPDFCFNLHGQRTIFGIGYENIPATLSFLAPAVDEERSINSIREKAMQVVSVIYDDLKNDLKNGIGRYDDSFNINCVGDTFQAEGVPTILFEAGHFPKDYKRETTRFYFFNALVSGLKAISVNNYKNILISSYFEIPENKKCLVDVLIKNVKHQDLFGQLGCIQIQFEEILKENKVHFRPVVINISIDNDKRGHFEIDANGNEVLKSDLTALKVTDEIDLVFMKNQKYLIKP